MTATPFTATPRSDDGANRTLIRALVLTAALFVIAVGTSAEEMAIMSLGFFAIGVLGVVEFGQLIVDWPRRWSMTALYAPIILGWYGIGAGIGLMFGQPDELGIVTPADHDALALAGIFVVATSACLWIVAPWESRFWTPILAAMSRSDKPIPISVILFLGLFTVLLGSMLIDGRITFRGFGHHQLDTPLQLPVLESLIQQVGIALVGYLGWVVGRRQLTNRGAVLLIGAALLPMLALIIVAEGRRTLVIQAIIFSSLFFVGRGIRLAPGRAVRLGLIMAPLLFLGALLFQGQREVLFSENSADLRGATLFESITLATELVTEDFRGAVEWQTENLPHRMFLIGYIKDLMLARDPQWGLGNGVLAEIIQAVPNFLMPDKREWIRELGGTGTSRNLHFNLPALDSPNSALSLAYMEFGWLGVPLTALLTSLVGLFNVWLLRLFDSDLFRWSVFSTVLALHLTVETTYITASLVTWRLLALLVVLHVVLSLDVSARPSATSSPAPRSHV